MSENQTIRLPPRSDQLGRASVFVAVARASSFSGAAAALGMARSTVSEQVRHLEDALGVKLLERTTRSVRLTEEGALLLEHMEVVHAAWGDAQHAFDARRSEPRGHLRVTAPVGLATSLVGPALCDLLASHPGVTADLIVDDGIRDLVSDGIDVAVRAAGLEDSRLVARRLGLMPLRLVAAPQHADLLNDGAHSLQEQSWVGHRSVSTHAVHLRRPGEPDVVRLRVQPRATASTSEGQVALLVGGVGLALMPWPLIADHVRRGTLVESRRWVGGELPLYAIYPARRLLPARTRALLDRLNDRLPALLEHAAATVEGEVGSDS